MQNYTNSVPQCKKCFRLCVLHPSSFLFVVAKELCFSQIACFVRELGLTYYLKYGALKSLPFSKTYECQKAKVPSSQKCNALIQSVFFSKQKSYKRYVQKPSVNQNNDILCHGIVFFFQEVSITNKSTMLLWYKWRSCCM